ncbi:winged helix-turn-helix domain-containing protein [Actinopolymorpha sp. B11F2]|uniref:winged helix-turn-helix domain-containing protein n=1 Tax=Actinopolymorpha sp. B11F2 TaxID=3160862 RepID=UPI0032E3EA55
MTVRRRPATEAEARALASAIRLRILRLCLDRALTNKQIAERLGANPATTLHHVRTLVATGFLDPQEARRGTRGAREVPYLATGKSWTLDVSELPGPARGLQAMIDAFLSEVEGALAERPDQIRASRLGLRLTAKERDEFDTRLNALLEEFKARQPGRTARAYSLFFALHPDLTRDS